MNNLKYSLVCEGENDKYFFIELKTRIFKNRKIRECKKHKSKIIKGTIRASSYIDGTDCCQVFYLIDQDNIKIESIKKHNKEIQRKNGILIISKPKIEIILLAIFQEVVNYTEKEIDKKLTESLIKHKLISATGKYLKSNNSSLKKIIDYLEKDHNNKKINFWINNLKKIQLTEHNIKFNNFISLIEYLKGN